MINDPSKILGHWVEVREEGDAGRLVLRPFSAPLPPARGRRSLVLEAENVAEARAPGPSDQSVGAPGSWSLDGDILTISTGSWSGKYRVEDLSEDKLVLSPA
jgi:hypothetical protein